MKILYLYVIIVMLITNVAQAQTSLWQTLTDYNYQDDPFFEGIDTVPEEELEDWVVVEETHILNGGEQELSLTLPNGEILTFIREHSHIDTFNVISWYGKNTNSVDYPNSLAHFQMHEDSLLGYITINDSFAYKLLPIRENLFICFGRYYHKKCDSDLMPNYADTNLRLSKLFNPFPFPILNCGGVNIYRMIIAYTPEFAATFTGTNRQKQINEFIQGVVDSTNNTYIRSGTNIRVRLALSYETDNEYGSRNKDSPAFARRASALFGNLYYERYDEIFNLRIQYNVDVAILLVSYDGGGRANMSSQTAIYSKFGAGPPVYVPNVGTYQGRYGVAHEVGHLFDLEHNRDEYTWFEQKSLDSKKAYGYRGWNGGYKSVMSYGDLQTRANLYSDPGYNFPNGQAAGNSKAKARNYMQNHLSNVFIYNDKYDWHESGRTIYFNQMSSQFAYNDLSLANYMIQSGAVVNCRAGNSIELRAGTIVNPGAEVLFEIENCQNTQVFRIRKNIGNVLFEPDSDSEELKVFPNPSTSNVKISLNFKEKKTI